MTEQTTGRHRVEPTPPARRRRHRSPRSLRPSRIAAGAVCAGLFGAVAVHVQAGGAAPAPGPVAVAPEADTYVSLATPDRNNGSSEKLAATSRPGDAKVIYLRFRVGEPAGRATLTLTRDDHHLSGEVSLRAVADSSWDEGSLTAASAPPPGATVGSVTTGRADTTVTFDVSDVVRSAGTYSFAITSSAADDVARFRSRETGAGGPVLAVGGGTVAPPPLDPTLKPWPTSPAPTTPTIPPLPSIAPPRTTSPAPTAAPTTTPSTSAPAPSPSGGPAPSPTGPTLFGTTVWTEGGESYTAALNRSIAAYGQPEAVRVFYPGLPAAWPGRAGASGGPVNVSFKATPRDVLSGALDARMAQWFASAPRDREVWWTYFHEPEDDIKRGSYTAADYRAAWRRLAELADKSGNPRLHATLVLMCWTMWPESGRNWKDYYPGAGVLDMLGWDCYNTSAPKGSYLDPARIMGPAVQASASVGLPWSVAELGSLLVAGDDGRGRAAWLKAAASYAEKNGARYVTYFDAPVAGEYRLLDAPSRQAWREVTSG
jgi:hypothetical protein